MNPTETRGMPGRFKGAKPPKSLLDGKNPSIVYIVNK